MANLKGLTTAMKELDKKEKEQSFTEKFLKEYDRIIEALNTKINNDQAISKRKVWKPSHISKCEINLYYYFLDKPANFNSVKARTWRAFGFGTAHHRWNQEEILAKVREVTDSKIELLDLNRLELPNGTKIIERKDPLEQKLQKALLELNLSEELVNTAVSKFNAENIIGIRDTEWKFFNEKYNVSGMIDGAISFETKNIIWEYKTIKPDDYKFLVEVHKKYLEQGAMYYLCLGIPYILFQYEDKGSHEFKAFEYEYKPVHSEWVIAKMERINKCIEHRVLPPKPVDDFNCKFCEYKEICIKREK